MDQEKIRAGVRLILEGIGEDPQREGLLETPRRVAEMYEELFAGFGRDPGEEVTVFFQEPHDEIVLVRDIPFNSVCEHHLLPFVGKAHVAYIPRNGRLTGLSKLARVIDMAARRPQLQERLTASVADALMQRLNPLGAAVVVEAEHMCMTMRGVRKPGSVTVTSAVRGVFLEDPRTRAELFSMIRSHGA